jgi:hypothetical protein
MAHNIPLPLFWMMLAGMGKLSGTSKVMTMLAELVSLAGELSSQSSHCSASTLLERTAGSKPAHRLARNLAPSVR